MAKMSFIEQLLGTRTKLRIFKVLIEEGEPLTRNKLAMITGMGIGSVYEQTDQLIALGALGGESGKISIDPDFPYFEQLRDLVLITEDHMNDLQTILRSIDRILGIDYYITGYVSACQNGMPIDVDENCILIMVNEPNTRKERMLNAISECTDYRLKWESANNIPKDVQRKTISGADVWISSVERGFVDSIKVNECGHYPIFLLLVQNVVDGSIDPIKVMEYAEDQGVGRIFGQAFSVISDRVKGFDHPYDLREEADPEVVKSVESALNTVMG